MNVVDYFGPKLAVSKKPLDNFGWARHSNSDGSIGVWVLCCFEKLKNLEEYVL